MRARKDCIAAKDFEPVYGSVDKLNAPAFLFLAHQGNTGSKKELKNDPRRDVTKNTKHFPHKSYQDLRIIKVSKFLEELEKQFSK